jgi:hypothetical protein
MSGYFGDIEDPPDGWLWVVPHWYPDHKPWRIQWSTNYARVDRERNRKLMAIPRTEYADDDPTPEMLRRPDFSFLTEDTVSIRGGSRLEYQVGWPHAKIHVKELRRKGSGLRSFVDDQGRTCYVEDHPDERYDPEEVGVPVWGF